jgi:hypothetical protein
MDRQDRIVAVGDTVAYVRNAMGTQLRGINVTTGKELWRLDLGGDSEVFTCGDNIMIYNEPEATLHTLRTN